MRSVAAGFEIAGVKVSRDSSPFVLAEIGINHNGNVEIAAELIRQAKQAGAHGVKFQTFKAEDLVNREKSPEYFELFRKCELDRPAHFYLKELADTEGIAFISTPFGEKEADLLNELGVAAVKIASGDLTNHALLAHVAGFRRPVILSTGMSDIREVRLARQVLIDAGCEKIALLHCVSRYPTKPEELNLNAIMTMCEEFPDVIGFSDHTEGIWAAPAAVAMGARFIEKHFTLDRKMDGPDHALSVEPSELRILVKSLQNVFKGLGDGLKEPCDEERKNRHLGRKGLYAAIDLVPGMVISREHVKLSRPQGEIQASELNEILGLKILSTILAGGEIKRESIGM